MTKAHAEFRKRLERALDSKNLETALNRTLPNRRKARAAAFAGLDFQGLREDLQRRKRAAIDRLPELIEQFTEAAEKAGAVVHRAATPADALAIVDRLVDEHHVRLVVKSKSMATEEIELNEHLEARGVEVVETDLGEWIVQLAHDRPSHLITPALHKTREEIAELFSKVTGQKIPADIPRLVAVARERLRQYFIDADMGITGANAAIAETGSLMIVTNEGNANLVHTLPPIHVAVLGIEKIVPTLDDATAMLRVLSRSGTGQRATTYVTYITGPSRTADIELSLTIGVHGPKEVHIILLDNGRTRMRERPEFRDALDCIRCGACLNACPPFQVVGGHVFGYRYTGPIGLVLTAFHHGQDEAEGPVSLCAQCNACETVCPAAINVPRMILDLRQEHRAGEPPGLAKGWFLDLLTYADGGRGALRAAAKIAQRPFQRGDGSVVLPFSGGRHLPSLPDRTLLERHGLGALFEPAPLLPSQVAGATLLYFPGCMTDNLFPAMGEAAVRVLTGCGARVRLPSQAVCCGLAHMNAGDRTTAIANAKRTIAMLEGEALERPDTSGWVVSTSASCVVAMTQDYPHLLRDEPAWARRAEALAGRIRDFTSFIDGIARLPAGSLAKGGVKAVTYHDSCQSSNCLKLGPEPRRVLQEVMGLELREMEEPGMCCGFGGTFSLDYPEVSRRILRHKLDHIAATGAPVVATDNPGCIMHIRGGLEASAGKDVRVVHVAELLAERLEQQGG